MATGLLAMTSITVPGEVAVSELEGQYSYERKTLADYAEIVLVCDGPCTAMELSRTLRMIGVWHHPQSLRRLLYTDKRFAQLATNWRIKLWTVA